MLADQIIFVVYRKDADRQPCYVVDLPIWVTSSPKISSNTLDFSSRKYEFLSAGSATKICPFVFNVVYKKCPEAVLGNTERKRSLKQPRKPTQNSPFRYILR